MIYDLNELIKFCNASVVLEKPKQPIVNEDLNLERLKIELLQKAKNKYGDNVLKISQAVGVCQPTVNKYLKQM